MRRVASLALALAATAAGGCQSQWFYETAHSEVVRTDVVVRTSPTGALVFLNGTRMDTAPIRIPVAYEHVTEQWFRQSNYGARIRESTGVWGTILLFPIWLPASLIHGTQEMKRHVYNGGRLSIAARMDGREPADRTIDIQGEAEVEVLLELAPGGR